MAVVVPGAEVVAPEQLDSIIASILARPDVDFWNMVTPLKELAELSNQSVVKCVLNQDSDILSIFRKSPLVVEVNHQIKLVYKICGLFAVSREALSVMAKMDPTPLEMSESIEQLKFLELGFKIRSIMTPLSYPSINLPEDVEMVSGILLTDNKQVEVLKKIL